MALKWWTGFESIRDDNDLRAQGWVTNSTTTTTSHTVLGIPSVTSLSGTSLKLMGPYGTAANVLPCTTATQADPGMYDTGLTVNALWTAGGFVWGTNGKFNSGTQNQIASTILDQIVYDGAQYYWAIQLTSTATYNVVYSTDLINWTATATPTTGALQATSRLSVIGSGATATVIVCPGGASGNATPDWPASYTTNLGLTWTSITNVSGITSNGGWTKIEATTNGTIPYMGTEASATLTTAGGLFALTGLTPTGATQVISGGGNANSRVRTIPGSSCLAYYTPQSSTTASIAAASASLATAGSWVATAAPGGTINDFAFYGGNWYAVTSTGIYSAPPASTSPTTGPTAAWSTRVTAAGIRAVATSSSLIVAVGYDATTTTRGAIWTSPDGVTWTKQNRLIRSSTAATGFSNVIYDGTQFIVFGGAAMNVIATSTDGFQWNPIYYPDYTEGTGTATPGIPGIFSGTLNASTGVYTPSTTAGVCGQGLAIGAISGGTRTVGLITVTASSATAATGATNGTAASSISTSPLDHYFALIFTATGTANQFTVQLEVDGAIVLAGTSAVQLAPTADTTSHAIINLGRTGNLSVFDDMYEVDFSGSSFNTSLGVINVIPSTPASDSQAQWTPGGSQASNAAAVASNSLTNALNAPGNFYVSTFTDGAKDIYNMSNTIPSNYKARAVLVEAFFERNGNTPPNVTVGIVSGSAEVDSAQVNIPTPSPTYVSTFTTNDPNTGIGWTNAGAAAAKMSITKVS